jgi:hypothetical protein
MSMEFSGVSASDASFDFEQASFDDASWQDTQSFIDVADSNIDYTIDDSVNLDAAIDTSAITNGETQETLPNVTQQTNLNLGGADSYEILYAPTTGANPSSITSSTPTDPSGQGDIVATSQVEISQVGGDSNSDSAAPQTQPNTQDDGQEKTFVQQVREGGANFLNEVNETLEILAEPLPSLGHVNPETGKWESDIPTAGDVFTESAQFVSNPIDSLDLTWEGSLPQQFLENPLDVAKDFVFSDSMQASWQEGNYVEFGAEAGLNILTGAAAIKFTPLTDKLTSGNGIVDDVMTKNTGALVPNNTYLEGENLTISMDDYDQRIGGWEVIDLGHTETTNGLEGMNKIVHTLKGTDGLVVSTDKPGMNRVHLEADDLETLDGLGFKVVPFARVKIAETGQTGILTRQYKFGTSDHVPELENRYLNEQSRVDFQDYQNLTEKYKSEFTINDPQFLVEENGSLNLFDIAIVPPESSFPESFNYWSILHPIQMNLNDINSKIDNAIENRNNKVN